MELYTRIIELIDVNLIFCLIPIIMTLIMVDLVFKNKFETKKALNIFRWIIIIYSIITWTITIIEVIRNPTDSVYINRAVGPYSYIYIMMLLLALVLPITLLSKKLGQKFWYVLLVSFCIKIGVYFERFVIITTSFHRDYLEDNDDLDFPNSFSYEIGLLIFQGVIIAILTLSILRLTKNKKLYTTLYKKT